ncbi:hypothetical protein K466DRAFT_337755 [Polyporus arcularius HHB13444]|uniref:Uncharacterized protein n=2 Tax=Polyporaceae TaxID=5317 RepID=A0A5C3PN32_9APHY|nr:hypothetical protein OH76DRAFT_1423511 [Polyporus brumalis]TFK91194.1 hypothetical protein K466DRAFT_337755 [Polyporus arcularius HHB13444]
MSAIAAQYANALDRRYADHAAHYDPATFFSYPQPSLNAVTANPALDGYALTPATAPSYVWDTHEPVQSPAYSTSSYSSSSAAANPGPSSLQNYAPEYSSHRPLVSSRPPAAFSAPSATASVLSSPTSRPSYASGPRSYSALAAAAASPAASPTIPSRLHNAQWDESALYTIEPSDPSTPPPPSPSSTHETPPIKEEDAEGAFIIEVSVPADQPTSSAMPEVPLRATHAPPKMRKMMYSFRLENFAIHDGIRSAATQPGPGGIEVGPLKQKPVMLEWQVELNEPLVPQDDVYQYGAAPSSAGKASSRTSSDLLRPHSPPSPRLSSRAVYDSTSSPSPSLSLEYTTAVDNDSWDAASSGYGSVTDPSTGSTSGMGGSPTFSSVMTPAQSLAWNLRYQESEMSMEASSYRRQGSLQSSLSRVSQAHGQYMLGGSSKPAYPQASQYGHGHGHGHDSSGFSRVSHGGSRYADAYASSASGSSWYRSS